MDTIVPHVLRIHTQKVNINEHIINTDIAFTILNRCMQIKENLFFIPVKVIVVMSDK